MPIYRWISSNVPPEGVIGAWSSGRLGFFSGRRVVNLDGLCNDQRLLAAIRQGRVASYIATSPITMLVLEPRWMNGFDPARPDAPPQPRSGIGEVIYELSRLPGIGLERADVPDDACYAAFIHRAGHRRLTYWFGRRS
jgi:hypothetical protein